MLRRARALVVASEMWTLLCLALIPPTIVENSCKFKKHGMVRDRQLQTWGGNVTQSREAYYERQHLIPEPLQEWFDEWLDDVGHTMLAFILGLVDGEVTKIYFYDSATGYHHGKELGHGSERRYDPVNYNEYDMVPELFIEHFGDTDGEGRVRYEVLPDGSEYRQAFHLTLQRTELRVRDKRRQLYQILKARGCDTQAFERWYRDHSGDRLTCLGFETESEAVTVYHTNDSYYEEDGECEDQ